MDATEHRQLLSFDTAIAAIMSDGRMPPHTRLLALTLAWGTLRSGAAYSGGLAQFEHLNTLLFTHRGAVPSDDPYGPFRHLWMMLREDVPRYEPPEGTYQCEAARLRGGGVCGRRGRRRVIDRDPVTGWWRPRWFCEYKHHQAAAQAAQEEVRAREPHPEPIPNRGGLLPCHFKHPDWAEFYSRIDRYWKPSPHGVCADEWPTPGAQKVQRPRLALVAGMLDHLPPAPPAGSAARPFLRALPAPEDSSRGSGGEGE